ncbi:hypothetical protein Q9966_002213 [Columba livia]|nr:hypothetical protein Q9966_002213 [Columba livia]
MLWPEVAFGDSWGPAAMWQGQLGEERVIRFLVQKTGIGKDSDLLYGSLLVLQPPDTLCMEPEFSQTAKEPRATFITELPAHAQEIHWFTAKLVEAEVHCWKHSNISPWTISALAAEVANLSMPPSLPMQTGPEDPSSHGQPGSAGDEAFAAGYWTDESGIVRRGVAREGYHQTRETYLGKSCTKLTAVSFENIMLPDLKVSSNSFIYKCVCDAHGWSLPIDSSMILAVRSLFRNDWPVDAQGKDVSAAEVSTDPPMFQKTEMGQVGMSQALDLNGKSMATHALNHSSTIITNSLSSTAIVPLHEKAQRGTLPKPNVTVMLLPLTHAEARFLSSFCNTSPKEVLSRVLEVSEAPEIPYLSLLPAGNPQSGLFSLVKYAPQDGEGLVLARVKCLMHGANGETVQLYCRQSTVGAAFGRGQSSVAIRTAEREAFVLVTTDIVKFAEDEMEAPGWTQRFLIGDKYSQDIISYVGQGAPGILLPSSM